MSRPPAPGGALVAAAALAVCTLLKLGLDGLVGRPAPFVLYFAAILLGAWRGGLRVGLATTAAAAVLADFFFIEPRFSLAMAAPHRDAAVRVVVFAAQGAVLSALASRAGLDRRRLLAGAAEQRAVVQKLQAVLDGVDDAIVVQDAAGRMLYANEVAAGLFGVGSADALRGAGPGDAVGRLEILDEQRQPVPPERMPGRSAIRAKAAVERELLFRVRATGVERWALVRSKPVLDADGNAGSVISVLRDVTGRRRDDARAAFVARATRELASSLDYAETLAVVARLAVPEVADWAAVDLVEGGRLALAHADPAEAARAAEVFPGPAAGAPPEAPTLVADVTAETLEAAARDPEHLAALRALGLRS
ncbi:MAG: Phytochrome, two-component sensor histidine kinase, partial [Myxococcaceae bacterium]|nr:Phytochrome, two-component sensor histidine kinase [Myxococcaceae bacterium]